MVNRYQILVPDEAGRPSDLIAFAEQQRLKLKEAIFFSTDETKTTSVFSLRSRQRIDMHARTDILDDTGTDIGRFRKDFATSLARCLSTVLARIEAATEERGALATHSNRRVPAGSKISRCNPDQLNAPGRR